MTAEGTASYVIATRTVTRTMRMGERLMGVINFDEGRFPIWITIDISEPSSAFVELRHPIRDEREGDRMVRDRVRLVWTEPTYGGRRGGFSARERT